MLPSLGRTLIALVVAASLAVSGAPAVRAQEAPPAFATYTEAAEFTVLNLLNLFRLEHGVQPLEWDPVLTDLARERSADMAERNYFGHDIPGVGYGPEWELSQLSGVIGTGENLGEGDESNETAMWSLFDAWVASPTHLENLLRPEFNRIGIGVVEVPTLRPERTIKVVTQVFAIAVGPVRRV
jgi:uncharacterized protein YkwD